ncbi:MAG: lytic transglycosylase domain-containing protein [Chloroflexi bacterium]|nr:lytic transglycosylase domain-containing protein [Chloroflexota bacterium]
MSPALQIGEWSRWPATAQPAQIGRTDVDRTGTDGAAHNVGQSAAVPEPEAPQAAEETAQDAMAAESPPAERARPRPFREYPVPPARAAGSWPFGLDVWRWQPVVEAELGLLRNSRQAHPMVNTELVLAVIAVESAGDPFAVSPAAAVGLMQVLPPTFAELLGDGDPFDPVLNLRAGIRYLSLALAHHFDDLEWALAGYNAGIGRPGRRATSDGSSASSERGRRARPGAAPFGSRSSWPTRGRTRRPGRPSASASWLVRCPAARRRHTRQTTHAGTVSQATTGMRSPGW